MSIDIDMESYAGAPNGPAAVDQPDTTNSYGQEEEYPVQKELLEQPVQEDLQREAEVKPEEPVINPQSEHFRALRDEVDRIKTEREAEKKEHQLQLDMLRANIARNEQPKTPEPSTKQMFEGLKDDDIPNVAEFRREWEQRETQYKAQLEELQVQQSHPDYVEVLQKFVGPLIQQKPHLAESIRRSSNPALAAYDMGKMAQMAQQVQPVIEAPKVNENAQRMVENSKKPGTLSQAGGQSVLSKADYFASMSDAEFYKMAQKNLGEI